MQGNYSHCVKVTAGLSEEFHLSLFFDFYGGTIKTCSLCSEEQYTNCLITITLLPCSIGTVICEQFWINV